MPDKPIWDRQEGETDSSYAAFCCYRDDLGGRTLLKAYAQHKGHQDAVNVPGFFAAWSVTHNWVERVRAYDAALEQQAREEREALWLERQRQLLEDEWDGSRRLLELALKMLELPLAVKREAYYDEYGELAVVNVPQGWSVRDAGRFLQLSAALGRQATGLDVVKHEHTGADGGPVEHVTMSLSEWKDQAAERRKAAEDALKAANE